ncbi:hypothetical protein B296_00003885 [Ensete ventricosum]|uniref:Uncharacterized protein n=1 Tax=Ensete ventricosum TaxID=4639 RepID=A0A426YHD0_ENSVE|nr:hypothetical protein B296_00003885 [Ensete ventricosum]
MEARLGLEKHSAVVSRVGASTEVPLESSGGICKKVSVRVVFATESPLELVVTESPLELIRTESLLELVGTKSTLELVEPLDRDPGMDRGAARCGVCEEGVALIPGKATLWRSFRGAYRSSCKVDSLVNRCQGNSRLHGCSPSSFQLHRCCSASSRSTHCHLPLAAAYYSSPLPPLLPLLPPSSSRTTGRSSRHCCLLPSLLAPSSPSSLASNCAHYHCPLATLIAPYLCHPPRLPYLLPSLPIAPSIDVPYRSPRHPLSLHPLLPVAFPPHQSTAAPSLALLCHQRVRRCTSALHYSRRSKFSHKPHPEEFSSNFSTCRVGKTTSGGNTASVLNARLKEDSTVCVFGIVRDAPICLEVPLPKC